MKRIFCLMLAAAFVLFAGCSQTEKRSQSVNQQQNVSNVLAQNATTTAASKKDAAVFHAAPIYADSQVQVDLTKMNSTMIYSEVSNMVNTPSEYKDKVVRMAGTFATNEYGGKRYYACLIADATACCAQGIEFVLDGDFAYPKDYPAVGQEITVTGIFDIYYEGDSMYCQLHNASMA